MVTGSLIAYPNVGNVSNWTDAAMIWVVQNCIINGSNGKLNSQGYITRAETAAMLTRFCKNVLDLGL